MIKAPSFNDNIFSFEEEIISKKKPKIILEKRLLDKMISFAEKGRIFENKAVPPNKRADM